MPLADYQSLVDKLVRDDSSRIATGDRDAAIARAVARLSAEKPRELVVESTNVSGQRVAVPDGWVKGTSQLRAVEYPVGDTPPTFVDAARVGVVDLPDGDQELMFLDALPAASTIRTSFTAPHVLDGTTDTIPPEDQWGVMALAASILCGELASFYANQTDSTIAADGVDHKSKSELWAAREREYFRQAFTSWGLPVPTSKAADEVAPAGAVVSFEPRRGVKRIVWW